jgi:hypothetical protein
MAKPPRYPIEQARNRNILRLARRRDKLGDDAKILPLAARAWWKGDPAERMLEWLADRRVEV